MASSSLTQSDPILQPPCRPFFVVFPHHGLGSLATHTSSSYLLMERIFSWHEALLWTRTSHCVEKWWGHKGLIFWTVFNICNIRQCNGGGALLRRLFGAGNTKSVRPITAWGAESEAGLPWRQSCDGSVLEGNNGCCCWRTVCLSTRLWPPLFKTWS